MSVVDGTGLAHRGDPDASHVAANSLSVSVKERLQAAILTILAEEPRAAFQVRGVYASLRRANGWPFLPDLHSVDKRMSELGDSGRIRRVSVAGKEVRVLNTQTNKTAHVWEVAPAVDPMPTILDILYPGLIR